MSFEETLFAEDESFDSTELLSQIKYITLKARRDTQNKMSGSYESAFRGRGMSFEKVREYQPGDDIRHIDWNVTARMRTPYIKEHREERELTMVVAMDISRSMFFGSEDLHKHACAVRTAALLAHSANHNKDQVGLLLFSDKVEYAMAPKKGRGHVWRLIRACLTKRPQGRQTQLKTGLQDLGHLVKRHAVVFVISDFQDDNYGEALKSCAQKHDVIAIRIVDPREEQLPDIGIVQWQDLESGAWFCVDTSDKKCRQTYLQKVRDDKERFQEICQQAQIGCVTIQTSGSLIDPLLHYFHQRQSRLLNKRLK